MASYSYYDLDTYRFSSDYNHDSTSLNSQSSYFNHFTNYSNNSEDNQFDYRLSLFQFENLSIKKLF